MNEDEAPKVFYHLPVYGDAEIKDAAHGLILIAPNGTKWRIQVDNTGALTATSL